MRALWAAILNRKSCACVNSRRTTSLKSSVFSYQNSTLHMDNQLAKHCTEDCKLVVTWKMQNRNATDKLNQQCSELALFANTITEFVVMLVY